MSKFHNMIFLKVSKKNLFDDFHLGYTFLYAGKTIRVAFCLIFILYA